MPVISQSGRFPPVSVRKQKKDERTRPPALAWLWQLCYRVLKVSLSVAQLSSKPTWISWTKCLTLRQLNMRDTPLGTVIPWMRLKEGVGEVGQYLREKYVPLQKHCCPMGVQSICSYSDGRP